MAVAGLILGIMGIVVFCWAGPLGGAAWAAVSSTASLMSGRVEVSTWQVWALGLGVGVGLPLVGLGLSIAGFVQGKNKGVALGGIVTGGLAALGGLIITLVLAWMGGLAGDQAEQRLGADGVNSDDFQKMINTLDVPAFQDQMRQMMDQAAKMQGSQPAKQPAGAPTEPARPAEAPPPPTIQPVPQENPAAPQVPVQPTAPPVGQPGQPAAQPIAQ